MSPIATDTDSMFLNVIIAIAPNVISGVNDEGSHAQLLGAALCKDCARKTCTNNEKVNFVWG
jgi:hypothetical protein